MIDNYRAFKEQCLCMNIQYPLLKYLDYLIIFLKYRIAFEAYFSNQLYDKRFNHDDYLKTTNFYMRKWVSAWPNYVSDQTKRWLAVHHVDYLIAKIRYPGLDAIDYFSYEFYNIRHAKRKTFITEGGLRKMCRQFNGSDKENRILLNDKTRFNQIFSEFINRKWIATYHCTQSEFNNFAKDLDKIIIKPLTGHGGQGIKIVLLGNEQERRALYEQFCNRHYILEQVISEHQDLLKLNPSSVNTVRVFSVFDLDHVDITAAVLRIGNGYEPIDNYSSGGFVAEIDVNSGIVISHAVSKKGVSVYRHPLTNEQIIGIRIPYWEKIKNTVKTAHQRIKTLRYVGWDIVVSDEGIITMIEANGYAGVSSQQHPSLNGKKPIYDKYLNGNK